MFSGRRPTPTKADVNSEARFYFIDISLRSIADESERNTFNGIPTALTIDRQTVDRLRAIARKLLLDSPDFKQLVKYLGG